MSDIPPSITVGVVQPPPFGLPPLSHVVAVPIGLDVLLNALLDGCAYQTISSRVGESMETGGWAAGVPWPA